jgi:hypothetical protein
MKPVSCVGAPLNKNQSKHQFVQSIIQTNNVSTTTTAETLIHPDGVKIISCSDSHCICKRGFDDGLITAYDGQWECLLHSAFRGMSDFAKLDTQQDDDDDDDDDDDVACNIPHVIPTTCPESSNRNSGQSLLLYYFLCNHMCIFRS